MNRTLEAIARAIFKSWFVDFDPVHAKAEGREPVGMDPETAALFPDSFQDSPIGRIPKGWKVARVGDHIEITRGLSYKGRALADAGMPLHNLNSIYEGGGYKRTGIKFYKGDFKVRHTTRPGDIIVANTEQTFDLLLIGYPARVPACFADEGIFSHHLYKVSLQSNSQLTEDYLYYALLHERLRREVANYSNGTTVNMLPKDALQRPYLLVPDRRTLGAFDDCMHGLQHLQALAEDEAPTLAGLRRRFAATTAIRGLGGHVKGWKGGVMRVRTRLVYLVFFFAALIVVGWIATGSFRFVFTDFWFTAGFLLLLLLSLVDQPHFSRDASAFVNGATAWVSLMLVPRMNREVFWWIFFAWALYLIASSFILMWVRSRSLGDEPRPVQLLSRVNRQLGRPEAIFSAFFLWGCIRQFGLASTELQPLFLFWAVFMIANLPAIARAIDQLFERNLASGPETAGYLVSITSPRAAEVSLSHELEPSVVGRTLSLCTRDGDKLAEGVVVDDRVVSGQRVGRVSLDEFSQGWRKVASSGANNSIVRFDQAGEDASGLAGVVEAGTTIGNLIVLAHPDRQLQEGEILTVKLESGAAAYYQIVSASVCESPLPEGNLAHSVRVSGGQLGIWDADTCRFSPIPWVPPAGRVVRRVGPDTELAQEIPDGNAVVGAVPNSSFPIHVSIEDIVTHNTAAIGVTGSGKSYLAFHLIEAIIDAGIKVMILDITREHDLYLTRHNPTALKVVADVSHWLESDSRIGIHQFAVDDKGYPAVTADFVGAAFQEISKATLVRGKNLPARLCIVFEEAHSLIPEWNQVSKDSDKHQVNRTARTLLQGRKFGLGALIITQRTANVTKTILNQCNTMFAMQSFDQTGLDFLRNYMGEEYTQAISTLPTRHAVLVGKASSSARPVIFEVCDLSERWQKSGQDAEDEEGAAEGEFE